MYSEYEFMFDLVFIISLMHKLQSNILNITDPEHYKKYKINNFYSCVLRIYLLILKQPAPLYDRTLLLKPRDA